MKIYPLSFLFVLFGLNFLFSSKAFSETYANSDNGILLKYYQGNWDRIPDFSALIPDEEHLVPSIDLGEFSPRSLNYFGLTFESYLEINSDGEYTFELTSDDGSKLYINDEILIDNDGLHGSVAKQSTIFLEEGFYPIKVEYFEKDRGQTLGLLYQYEGKNFHEIPGKKLYLDIPKDPHKHLNKGVLSKFYQGQNWSLLPDFEILNHKSSEELSSFGLGSYAERSLDNFGLVLTSYLYVDKNTYYTFRLTSDDGSKLFLNNDLLINNDGLHGPVAKESTVFLEEGFYPIKIEYFENIGGQTLGLSYQYEDKNFHEIPEKMLFLETPKPYDGLNRGILSKFYQGQDWNLLPDFEALNHESSEVIPSISLGSYTERSLDNFGLVLTGFLYIDEDANYTFRITSDDGSKLLLSDNLLIDNDGLHGAISQVSDELFLSEGMYPLQIEYFEKSRGQTLMLEYSKDDGVFTNIPEQNLFHASDETPKTPPVPPEPPQSPAKVAMPIEVIGKEGTSVSRELYLSPSQAEQGVLLWLQVNNLGYQDKASIQINDGKWISLNHETVQLEKQEAARGGMVHGGFNTIRFSLPLDEPLLSGDNQIRFRFNHSDGVSIGYRVIGFNILDNNGNKILPSSRFQMEDPAEWVPPYSDPQMIEEGERLWKNGNLISSYLETEGNWYAYPIPPKEPIRAKCADCHTQDGRDLEIFSYSNHSIIERSKFHGLSEEDGKLIASYIRSLSTEQGGVGRYGRPWNPPYQPGPQIASRPPEEWAAGAGLEAVLDEDKDMLLGMFGKTSKITKSDVNEYFDSDKMWDTSLQPLAIQLPDWKHWLPLIHPKDAFSRSNYYQNTDKKYDPSKAYDEIRKYLTNTNEYTEKSLFHQLHQFWLNFRMFLQQGGSKADHWRTTDGDPFTKGLKNGVSKEMAATSLARLLAVKFFELHQEFKLEGLATQLIDGAEQPRKRQWLGRQYNVFEVPAHFTACFKPGSARCHNFEGQPRETGIFESTAWYQLQQVINPGIATSRDVVPVDYNYQPTLILRASETSQIKEPVRFFYSSNVMYQTRTRVAYFTPNDKEGFNMRVMGPWLFFGSDNRNNFEGLQVGEMPKLLNNIQSGLGTMIVNAQLKQFLKEMEKPRNSVDIWKRRASSDKGEHKHLDPINLSDQDMPRLDTVFSGKLRHYAHKIYWVIPRFINFGADCNLIDDLKDWSASAWPKINWNKFDCR